MRFTNCIDCPYPFVADTTTESIENIDDQSEQGYKIPIKILDNSVIVGDIMYLPKYINFEILQTWIQYLMKDDQTLVIPYKRENGINYRELYSQYIYDIDLVRSGYPGRNIIISRYSDTLVYLADREDAITIIPYGFKNIYDGLGRLYGYRKCNCIFKIIEQVFAGKREDVRNWDHAQNVVETCIKQIEQAIGIDNLYSGDFVLFGWMSQMIHSNLLDAFKRCTLYKPKNIDYSTLIQYREDATPISPKIRKIKNNCDLIENYIKSIEHTRSALSKLHHLYDDVMLREDLKLSVIDSMTDIIVMLRHHLMDYVNVEQHIRDVKESIDYPNRMF